MIKWKVLERLTDGRVMKQAEGSDGRYGKIWQFTNSVSWSVFQYSGDNEIAQGSSKTIQQAQKEAEKYLV